MARVTVLGDGAWGTAIAQLLAHNGHEVLLWCHNPEVATEINAQHTNTRFLPSISLHVNIQAITSLEDALSSSHAIFEAIPVKFLRAVLGGTKPSHGLTQIWVTLSKGIEQTSLKFPTQIIQELFPNAQCVALSGPSYAHDVARCEPTLVSLAAEDQTLAQAIAALVCNKNFSVQHSADILGVQACGAYKNIAAIALGILEGAGYGHNTRTRAFMQALAEMQQLVTMFGGNPATVYTPAGIGDLVLTTQGQSKNRALGIQLGQGKTLHALTEHFGSTPEGVNTTASLMQVAQQHSIVLPLATAVFGILFQEKEISSLIFAL